MTETAGNVQRNVFLIEIIEVADFEEQQDLWIDHEPAGYDQFARLENMGPDAGLS